MEIRKVPASAGAEWLLESFRLLRRSPAGFGLLGVIYSGLWLGMALFAASFPQLAAVMQLAFMVAGALLVALMIYAAQEVDAGRSASLGALFGSMRGDNGGRMIRALVPQAIFGLGMVGLVYLLIGQDNLVKAMETMADLQAKAQAGVQVDPNTVLDGPLVRVAIGGMLILGISVLVFIFTMTLLPDMLLGDRKLGEALRRSAGAGLRNLPAMLLYLILGFVLLMAISIGVGIALGVAQLVFGPAAAVVGNALLYGLIMNLIAATMYFAWKQMLGGGDTTAPAEPSGVAM